MGGGVNAVGGGDGSDEVETTSGRHTGAAGGEWRRLRNGEQVLWSLNMLRGGVDYAGSGVDEAGSGVHDPARVDDGIGYGRDTGDAIFGVNRRSQYHVIAGDVDEISVLKPGNCRRH